MLSQHIFKSKYLLIQPWKPYKPYLYPVVLFEGYQLKVVLTVKNADVNIKCQIMLSLFGNYMGCSGTSFHQRLESSVRVNQLDAFRRLVAMKIAVFGRTRLRCFNGDETKLEELKPPDKLMDNHNQAKTSQHSSMYFEIKLSAS